ncbi:hypothetical protein EDB85DRAFT_1895238 [Lactarius pseudohatsudake]|nr:hypothetical protein EDB85DRAFT_1895238 [Lactarius pseudohatsudake]
MSPSPSPLLLPSLGLGPLHWQGPWWQSVARAAWGCVREVDHACDNDNIKFLNTTSPMQPQPDQAANRRRHHPTTGTSDHRLGHKGEVQGPQLDNGDIEAKTKATPNNMESRTGLCPGSLPPTLLLIVTNSEHTASSTGAKNYPITSVTVTSHVQSNQVCDFSPMSGRPEGDPLLPSHSRSFGELHQVWPAFPTFKPSTLPASLLITRVSVLLPSSQRVVR